MTEPMDFQPADCHSHVGGIDGIAELFEIMEAAGLRSFNILSIPLRGDWALSQNCIALLAKALHPGRVYAFGGLRHPLSGAVRDPLTYEEQARRLIEAGCDGMKMLEGKPTERKALQEPLDSPDYDAYYAYLESEGIPLLFHVADPETFWDPNMREGWRDHPWFYGDGTHPSKEEIYQEMGRVLERFPGLRIIFAHFYFLSADLKRAADLLEQYPNMHLDLTPGGEMYWNFSKQPELSREFFLTHQDRILFGTDNMAGGTEYREWHTGRAAALNKIRSMRTFLETPRSFDWLDGQQHGIALDRDVLENIYAGNFHRLAGKAPKPVNVELAVDECKRIMALASQSPVGSDSLAELERIVATLQGLR